MNNSFQYHVASRGLETNGPHSSLWIGNTEIINVALSLKNLSHSLHSSQGYIPLRNLQPYSWRQNRNTDGFICLKSTLGIVWLLLCDMSCYFIDQALFLHSPCGFPLGLTPRGYSSKSFCTMLPSGKQCIYALSGMIWQNVYIHGESLIGIH